jgi:hypothetical protein
MKSFFLKNYTMPPSLKQKAVDGIEGANAGLPVPGYDLECRLFFEKKK